jgi:hypothetical protein
LCLFLGYLHNYIHAAFLHRKLINCEQFHQERRLFLGEAYSILFSRD